MITQTDCLRRAGPFGKWRGEVADAVAGARRPDASVWERSHAVRALEQILVPRLSEERLRMAVLSELLDRRTRERIWVAGELVERLYRTLVDEVRLPLRGAEFASDLDALLRAMTCWCEESERALQLAEGS